MIYNNMKDTFGVSILLFPLSSFHPLTPLTAFQISISFEPGVKQKMMCQHRDPYLGTYIPE